MATRGSERQASNAASAPAPTGRHPSSVRNVVLVGPSGSGKTSLVETLLTAAGTLTRPGSVDEGTTVGDHDPASVRQHRSVGLSVAPLQHADTTINLVDTPGYADFVGDLRAGLRAADAALFVVSATHGVDLATRATWDECAAVGMPRAVVVTHLDHARADVAGTVAALRGALGDGVHPVYEEAEGGLVGLISLRRSRYDGTVRTLTDPDPGELDGLGAERNDLIEAVIGESEDETLMERYLAGEAIEADVLLSDLATAVVRGTLYPVFLASTATGVGADEILDAIPRIFPSPLERPLPIVSDLAGREHSPLDADPDGPLAAEVIRTDVDAYVGRVCLLRMFSGTLRPDDSVHVSGHGLAARGHEDHDVDERVAHVYSALGGSLREIPYAVAGDLCAVTKVSSAQAGDTLSSPRDTLLIDPWPLPEPLLPIAVTAATRRDEDTLLRNLGRVAAADPALRLDHNPETGQLVIWCMGEAHADVVLSRLGEGGAQIETEPVRVALRETFGSAATGHGRHVKQSGGHGQYAVCDIEVEPLPRGAGIEFVDAVTGGAVPKPFIPSVEKGVRAQLARGLRDGHPVVDVRIRLVGGKAHSVDSSDAAFQTAGALAVKDAAASAQVIVLEPLDEVHVDVSDDHLGTILDDLSARHAQVLGTETGSATGRTVVRATVPSTRLLRYLVELRSLTSGSGSFTRSFSRYEVMSDGGRDSTHLQ